MLSYATNQPKSTVELGYLWNKIKFVQWGFFIGKIGSFYNDVQLFTMYIDKLPRQQILRYLCWKLNQYRMDPVLPAVHKNYRIELTAFLGASKRL